MLSVESGSDHDYSNSRQSPGTNVPHPLQISPDLDALLAQVEEKRLKPINAARPSSAGSQYSLQPPPRGPRRTSKPGTPTSPIPPTLLLPSTPPSATTPLSPPLTTPTSYFDSLTSLSRRKMSLSNMPNAGNPASSTSSINTYSALFYRPGGSRRPSDADGTESLRDRAEPSTQPTVPAGDMNKLDRMLGAGASATYRERSANKESSPSPVDWPTPNPQPSAPMAIDLTKHDSLRRKPQRDKKPLPFFSSRSRSLSRERSDDVEQKRANKSQVKLDRLLGRNSIDANASRSAADSFDLERERTDDDPKRESFIDFGSSGATGRSSDSKMPLFASRKSTSSHSTPTVPKRPAPSPHTHSNSQSSISSSSGPPLPPTTNVLNAQDRAGLIRKNRKLAKVFGETPNLFTKDEPIPPPANSLFVPGGPPRRPSHRAVRSEDVFTHAVPPLPAVWPPAPEQETIYLNANGRRHSTPYSPSMANTSGFFESRSQDDLSLYSRPRRHSDADGESSFMNLSDEEEADEARVSDDEREPPRSSTPSEDDSDADSTHPRVARSTISHHTVASSSVGSHRTTAFIPPVPELSSSDTEPHPPEEEHEAAEEEEESSPEKDSRKDDHPSDEEPNEEEMRKRLRAKVAKLHRFLGSRVPPELVIGSDNMDIPQARRSSPPSAFNMAPASDEGVLGWMKRRRRSLSSASDGANKYMGSPASPPTVGARDSLGQRLLEHERLQDDLSDGERMVNVRRAVKMNKLFGEQPPQMLYHTRAPIVSPRQSALPPLVTPPLSPTSDYDTTPPPTAGQSFFARSSFSPIASRPSTSSMATRPLLSSSRHSSRPSTANSATNTRRPGTAGSATSSLGPEVQLADPSGASAQYLHYRRSLRSLKDIIDNDDRESLAQLYMYVNKDSTSEDEADEPLIVPRPSYPRRLSLPQTRTSIGSLLGEVPDPEPPNPLGFQSRRRRAAKLTHFFGVNYRDLFGEVLDSIEMGVQEEVDRGTMSAAEIRELMTRLRILKERRSQMPTGI